MPEIPMLYSIAAQVYHPTGRVPGRIRKHFIEDSYISRPNDMICLVLERTSGDTFHDRPARFSPAHWRVVYSNPPEDDRRDVRFVCLDARAIGPVEDVGILDRRKYDELMERFTTLAARRGQVLEEMVVDETAIDISACGLALYYGELWLGAEEGSFEFARCRYVLSKLDGMDNGGRLKLFDNTERIQRSYLFREDVWREQTFHRLDSGAEDCVCPGWQYRLIPESAPDPFVPATEQQTEEGC